MKEINFKSSTIEKGLDIVKEFLQSVMKPSLDEVGELLADKVKLWRLTNQIKNIEKVKAIVEKEGINTKAINMKVLFPYLDAVALEEDETLQDMWANLFVNYIDSDKNLTLTVYPEILRQLSSEEVKMLSQVYKHSGPSGISLDAKEEVVSNLVRLGLLESTIKINDESFDAYSMSGPKKITQYKYQKTKKYICTDFGKVFFLACTRNKQ